MEVFPYSSLLLYGAEGGMDDGVGGAGGGQQPHSQCLGPHTVLYKAGPIREVASNDTEFWVSDFTYYIL